MTADEQTHLMGGRPVACAQDRHTRARWAQRAALWLALGALLALGACGQGASGTGSGTVPGTATARAKTTPTQGIARTVTASPQATPANSPFVCANPAGSSLTYAFVNADRQIYAVTGCSAPVQLTHLQRPDTLSLPSPAAWSPSHRYLAFHPNLQQDSCLKILDTATGASLATKFDCFNGDPTAPDTDDQRSFVGWIDDDTFLGKVDITTSTPPDPARLVRVNIHTQAETLVKSYAWVSDPKLRGAFVFFGSRINPNDTTAYLYRLSLADGSDTRLVPLGLSGHGGCQVVPGPCSWTAPWDVSPDGTHLLYHNPGADILPTDTQGPHDTPVYYASVDGTGAVRVLAGLGAQGMLAPAFDPSGRLATAVAANSTGTTADFVYQALPQGAIQRVASADYLIWRSDGQAYIDTKMGYSGDVTLSAPTLHILGSQASTPLAANTFFYLWAS